MDIVIFIQLSTKVKAGLTQSQATMMGLWSADHFTMLLSLSWLAWIAILVTYTAIPALSPLQSLNLNIGPLLARNMYRTSRPGYLSLSTFSNKMQLPAIQKQPQLMQPLLILLAEADEERKAKLDITVPCGHCGDTAIFSSGRMNKD